MQRLIPNLANQCSFDETVCCLMVLSVSTFIVFFCIIFLVSVWSVLIKFFKKKKLLFARAMWYASFPPFILIHNNLWKQLEQCFK